MSELRLLKEKRESLIEANVHNSLLITKLRPPSMLGHTRARASSLVLTYPLRSH